MERSSEIGDRSAPVVVVPYDSAWPAQFAAEREVLLEALGPDLIRSIEHVGSTAVPGLASKPIIDIMVGVECLECPRAALDTLKRLGYCYYPYRPESMRWFCKPSPQVRTHHLYLVEMGSPTWVERIAFRDFLRAHPQVAEQYAGIKLALAARYYHDREAYTSAKRRFVEETVRRALRE